MVYVAQVNPATIVEMLRATAGKTTQAQDALCAPIHKVELR